MTFGAVIQVLLGVFKFWDQVTWLIKTLQDTPQEQHDKLMAKLRETSEREAKTGLPVWD